MRETIVKKIGFETVSCSLGGEKNSYGELMVMIDHNFHRIEFECAAGAMPQIDTVLSFCLHDKDVRREMEYAAEQIPDPDTAGYYWICHYGMSGCNDNTLFLDRAQHDWAKGLGLGKEKVLSYHLSAAGKFNEGFPDFTAKTLYLFLLYEGCDPLQKTSGKGFWYKKFQHALDLTA